MREIIKRIAIAFVLMVVIALCQSAEAQSTTVTATVRDRTGALVTSGQVTFDEIPSTLTTDGVSIFTPNKVTCTINGSGLLKALDGVSACVVGYNTIVTPAGTFYRVTFFPYFGKTAVMNFFAFQASQDLSTIVPTPGTMPFYSFVDLATTQTITGNKTFSGTTSFANASFTGNVSFKNIGGVRFVDSSNSAGWPGSDPGAWINAAWADLLSNGSCGTVRLGQLAMSYSTALNADLSNSCSLRGNGGLGAGARSTSQLTWTGTTTPVFARSSNRFFASGIDFRWNNPAFSGPYFDFGHTGTGCGGGGCDTAFADVGDVFFGKTGSGVDISPIIRADKAIESRFHDGNYNNYIIGIRGSDNSASYSNTNQVYRNQFQNDASSVDAIQNPASGWNMYDNTIILNTGGGFLGFDSAVSSAHSLANRVAGLWAGDASTCTPTVPLIDIGGAGFTLEASYLNWCTTAGTATLINIRNAVDGVTIKGNTIDNALNGIVLGTGIKHLDYSGNLWGVSLTNRVTGTAQMGNVPTRAVINQLAQTASIGPTAIISSADIGLYRLDVYIASTVVCATPGPASVNFQFTYTSDAGVLTNSQITLALGALSTTTAVGNAMAAFYVNSVSNINYATTYTACTSGTGTYNLRIAAMKIDQLP